MTADAYNPYVQAARQRQAIILLQQQAARLSKMRSGEGPSQVEKNQREEEVRRFLQELRQVLFDSMPNPGDVKRKYRKGISVNKFSKYKQVMESLHERSCTLD